MSPELAGGSLPLAPTGTGKLDTETGVAYQGTEDTKVGAPG